MAENETIERAGGGAAPSLDLRRESVHGIESRVERARARNAPKKPAELPPGICERKPYWVTTKERPELRFPASCDAYLCPVCGPRKAEQAAALMTWSIRQAGRARLVTFTNAPREWQPRRQKIRNLRRWALQEGYDWEIGWATEVGSKTGMVHVHGIQHGRHKIPQDVLQERWGAIVDIRAVRTPKAGIYAVKEALTVAGYVSKGATGDAEGLRAHLGLNGGRAAHWSRGFLHGRTKREALGEIRTELASGEALTWTMVPAWKI